MPILREAFAEFLWIALETKAQRSLWVALKNSAQRFPKGRVEKLSTTLS
ncbi:hypothetical protein [Leptospira noguchii]|nr:hypothetical protein [Leptospira noguchii]UOG31558.1 hypothetical protein MAL06_06000 [Leptospira noguchii]UOG51660.1 hypothetical protein MAL09_13290 [Leptospira noguchii]